MSKSTLAANPHDTVSTGLSRRVRVALAIIAVIAGCGTLLAACVDVASAIREHVPLRWIVDTDEKGRAVALSFWAWTWLLFVTAGLVVLIAAFVRYVGQMDSTGRNRQLANENLALSARLDAANEIIIQTMSDVSACGDVWRRSAAGSEVWRYTKVEEHFSVEAEGTTIANRTYEIEACDTVVGFPIFLFADETAQAAATPRDVGFWASSLDGDGSAVRWLLSRNDPHHKDFVLVFTPPIPAGETRRIRTGYRWPQFAADLIGPKRSTEFSFRFRSRDPADVAAVEMQFTFDTGLGAVEMVLKDPTLGELIPSGDGASVKRVWLFRAPTMKMHDTQLVVLAKLP